MKTPAPLAGIRILEVGTMLAGMHLAATDFALIQPNLRGIDWWTETVPAVLPHLEPRLAELPAAEVAVDVIADRSKFLRRGRLVQHDELRAHHQ